MRPEQGSWPKLEALFHQIVELSPDQRFEFLDLNCPDEPELRRQLEKLLLADDHPVTTWAGLERGETPQPQKAEQVEIAGYEDLELLGAGGMGTVYLARRTDAFFDGKPFAIKVLHAHRTSLRGRQRFETERRLLASLDHPNIVRLYDGGELPDGRPYLVMDYVEGRPLDTYCCEERLSIEQRLRLFQQICEALHYAHQNLVVHRDLKPSNILVDAKGKPHLLDFGIAKRLDHQNQASLTTGWLVPMTPAYASPEQIAGRSVTTASDLYSAGLVLYELLTDRLPEPSSADRDTLREPEKPSSRITELEQASARRTTLPALRRSLRGDLDHIVGKTLRFDPSARFASARELAQDIERYLHHLPVLARRGGWSYLAGRFLRRHRFFFALAGAGLLVLTLAVTTSIQSRRLSEAEAAGAEKDLLVRRLVGPRAGVLTNLSVALVDMRQEELLAEAEAHAREALELMIVALGPEHNQTLRARHNHSMMLSRTGQQEASLALSLENLEISQQVLGQDHVRLGYLLIAIARLHHELGQVEACVDYARRSVDLREKKLPTGHFLTAVSKTRLAVCLGELGQKTEAIAILRTSVATLEQSKVDDQNWLHLARTTLAQLTTEGG